MRMLVNCPSGESRLLQVDRLATVLELKSVLQDAEGIPVDQQILCFAGQQLKNHLSLADHNLEDYTLSDEVVLYLSKKLRNSMQIFLTSRHKLSQRTAELVECDMPVSAVQALLESRGLACPFATGASVIMKRQDGSTSPVLVDATDSLSTLISQVNAKEGVYPTSLTFSQAQDGAMHITLGPSKLASTDTYPVYSRNAKLQLTMMKAHSPCGQPLPDLVQELCVLP